MDATPLGADTPASPTISEIEAPTKSAPLAGSDIVGLKYFDQLLPLLERLKDDGCLRDPQDLHEARSAPHTESLDRNSRPFPRETI